MKKFLLALAGAAFAVVLACSQGAAPTEPQPVPVPTVPVPPTVTPAPSGCSFTGIQVINGSCYQCVNGTIGTIACPAPSPSPTAVAPCPPPGQYGCFDCSGHQVCVDPPPSPTPAPATCNHEGQQWAIAGPNGVVCYFCHFGQALEVPCAPAPSPTPAGCVSPCNP